MEDIDIGGPAATG